MAPFLLTFIVFQPAPGTNPCPTAQPCNPSGPLDPPLSQAGDLLALLHSLPLLAAFPSHLRT